jgi:peptidoglycan/LPS O-acetylase OafA/YrhL
MAVGEKRTMVARIGAALGFLCGVIGLLAGLTQDVWKWGPLEWFTGGTLLTLLAVYALVDGAIAFQKTQPLK